MPKLSWICVYGFLCGVLSATQAYAQIEPTPSFVDFGDVLVGTSSTEMVTVHNYSTQVISPVQIALDGDWVDFQIQTGGCVQLLPDASCTVWINFYPQTIGYFTTLLTIQAGGQFATVNVSGSGYKPYPISVMRAGSSRSVGSAQ